MDLDIDVARFRLVPTAAYVREVYYGDLFVLAQNYNDPHCLWEQARALDGAASLLRYRWQRLSAHQRLRFLAAIEGRHSAAGRD